ncbi:GNAT family N-acetyltransferase [Tenacibaculum tangerinum]|uniref:GNAT family N-acetyltransferase n=1 Tax=Tenacibaculum tangerinum TaxID=3038772 RepID=A0ABY8L8M0_9FLAO|nr:GNAT family N-acetyltransferase [Tenacibaculum tangerinum]WGH76937.1 GNAT family N-acetyltransferase [Tenacibaculum tangerinum]
MISISKEKSKLQLDVIYSFLTNSYWAKGRTMEEVENTIKNSLCFGIYDGELQIGFARVASDYTVFAYLMDVFILPEYRGNGYSKKLLHEIIHAPELATCKTWLLKTRDAHGLYKHFEFTELAHPERLMERLL